MELRYKDQYREDTTNVKHLEHLVVEIDFFEFEYYLYVKLSFDIGSPLNGTYSKSRQYVDRKLYSPLKEYG